MSTPVFLTEVPRDCPIIFEDPATHDLIVRFYGNESDPSRMTWNKCLRQSMQMKGFIRDDLHHHRDGKLEIIEQHRISLVRHPGIRSFIVGFCRCYWCLYVTSDPNDANLHSAPTSILKVGSGRYQMVHNRRAN